MTREEAARRYLESSRAASAAGRGSERESIEHDTQERLRRRHPGVHEHALVGADEDFDQPLAAVHHASSPRRAPSHPAACRRCPSR